MTQSTCTHADCDAQVYAKKLCRLHYRRTRPRTPDIIAQVPCFNCGKLVDTPKRAQRWAHRFCSYECRSISLRPKTQAPRKPRVRKPTPPKPAPTPRHVECRWCGEAFTTTKSTALYCGTDCKDKAKRVRRRGREHDAPGTYTWTDITRLWLTFDKRCAYCSTPTTLDMIQPEHVTPLSRGGRNDVTNLLPSCLNCNADKRDLLLHEWKQDRQRRGLRVVKTTWNDSDTRYRHLIQGQLILAA